MSEATKEKIRRFQKSFVKTEEHLRKINSRYRNTRPEMAVRSFLENLGLEVLSQFFVKDIWHPYDFYIPELKILIEVDGCYWHGCGMHGYSNPAQRERDNRWEKKAAASGLKVIRIWEHDVGGWFFDDLVRGLFHA